MTARQHRKACKLVLRDKDLTSHARLLWSVIETYADKNGMNAYPKLSTLAKDVGHKVDWVCKYRNELRHYGLLKWTTIKREDGTNEACRYVVLYPGHEDPSLIPQNGVESPYPAKRDTTGESLVMRQNGELDDLEPKRWNGFRR